ncbi:hypothetical protein C900_05438 [Fulvivirga imtechensis AK7]|uniref:Uncharacterized protein n=2 Tax=Fulvivirga TaxID=396811 RepID=L8JND9_9BACT|nr:hypothetical protein C900_05438 [Fulvivirga imtechensis AK7]
MLEIISPHYASLVLANYEIIRHVRLCWLAEEELELKYPDHIINNELCFEKENGVIRFRLQQNNETVARIHF